MAISSDDEEPTFLRDKHEVYCVRTLNIVPGVFEFYDSTRLMVAFFSVSTLDLLHALPKVDDLKQGFIDWIYHLQVVPDETEESRELCGFRGSAPCTVFSQDLQIASAEFFDKPQIAMTYAALSSLLIMGDDLSRVNRKCIILSLKRLQLPDGSFSPMYEACENDMRFVYCACCISYILHDWSGVNKESAIQYILNSITYEGGIAQGPGLEAHGGSTFCAVASLWLMGELKSLSEQQMKNLKRWCLFRQQDGFQGRPNKPSDTCYSFWVGSTLKLLDCYEFVDHDALRKYVLSAQDPFIGGIAKWKDEIPDPLHTYLAISGLSLMQKEDIFPIHPALNISERAVAYLHSLHEKWSKES